MKAHIVLAHPEQKSFNGQLASLSQSTLANAHYQTTISDLYAMDFDPREGPSQYQSRKDSDFFHTQTEQRFSADHEVLPSNIELEIQSLLKCDLLVVHFPLWWFGMPAILKGWIDRVFVYGRIYRSTMRYDAGICSGKKMIACVTTGASEDNCAYNGREGDTYLHLWPLLFPFRYIGFDVFEPVVFNGVGGVAFMEGHADGLSTLDQYTKRWEATLNALPSRAIMNYNRDGDFDETNRLRPGAVVHSPFIRHKQSSV